MNKPHCYSKMNWILKYPIGMEPIDSICDCSHGSFKCMLLTRKKEKLKNGKKNAPTKEGEIKP